MKTFRKLYEQICSYDNLHLAFKKAKKGKTSKEYVKVFESDLNGNLHELRTELLLHSYKPKPLKTFILHDPKTRKIHKSAFRDRVVHHALCNIIEPIFSKQFVHDSYANQKGKGTLKAIERFKYFSRKVSKNFSLQNNKRCIKGFVLKADIKPFFNSVNQRILIEIIKKKIFDLRVMWLIRTILSNYHSFRDGFGMPLGNLTSQFFANVYLNELDYFIKHDLKLKYYIRYVDDFIILHRSNDYLLKLKEKIDDFLLVKLKLLLHPEKTRVFSLFRGTAFLGHRIFPFYNLLQKKNLKVINKRIDYFIRLHKKKQINYDKIYDSIEGWVGYAKHANTFKLRTKILRNIQIYFDGMISNKEVDRWSKLTSSLQS